MIATIPEKNTTFATVAGIERAVEGCFYLPCRMYYLPPLMNELGTPPLLFRFLLLVAVFPTTIVVCFGFGKDLPGRSPRQQLGSNWFLVSTRSAGLC